MTELFEPVLDKDAIAAQLPLRYACAQLGIYLDAFERYLPSEVQGADA